MTENLWGTAKREKGKFSKKRCSNIKTGKGVFKICSTG